MNEYSREIEEVLNEMISLLLIPHFEQLGMNATGEWEQNIQARGNEIWGRDYTKYLVEGRPPNTDTSPDAVRRWAYGMANFNPEFKKWLQARGLTEYGVQIAYKIGMEGTNYYPQGTDLIEFLETPEVKNFITDRLKDVIAPKIAMQLTQEINLIFRR